MFTPFAKAFQQLPEPAFRSVLFKSLALTVAVLLGAWFGAQYLVQAYTSFESEWLQTFAEWAGFAIFLVALSVLFPAIATLFISLFLDDIADAVERRHYPQDPTGKAAPLVASLLLSMRFVLVMLVLNILALPLYLIPAINLFVFYGLNGYLLSREYFELVSIRHMPVSDVRALRRAHRGRLFLVGVVIAFLMTVPIVNLIAPIVATAAMVHVYKTLSARHAS